MSDPTTPAAGEAVAAPQHADATEPSVTPAAAQAPEAPAADAAPASAGTPAVSASGAATGPTPANVADIEEAMRDVVDPELGINVVDLGLVYGITVDPAGQAVIDMTLTSAACPLTDVLEDQTAQALEGIVPSHRLNWVWMPPWGPDKITPDGREQLRALGFNV